MAEDRAAAARKLGGNFLGGAGKVAGVGVFGVGGSLVEVVLVESIGQPLRGVAHGVGTVDPGRCVGSDTKAITALGRITDVVELGLDRVRAERRLGNAGQIGNHTAADGIIGGRGKVGHSFPSGVLCGACLGRVRWVIRGGIDTSGGHFGNLH